MNEFDYLAKAKKNMEKERYHEALDKIDNYINTGGNIYKEVYKIRGNANFELKNYKAAITDYIKGLAFEEDADLYYSLGLSYDKLKQFSLACENFKKALKINPQVEEDKYYKIPFLVKMFM